MYSLETRPPSAIEAKPADVGEWKNVTLRPVPPSIPDRFLDKHLTLPIVPPRRKKSEKLVKSGGFKEVFGNLTRPPSCDSNISTIKDLQLQRRKSSSNIPTGEDVGITDDIRKSKLVRKVSKVGNRKSDQFFGENLSDCLSDEPVIDVLPMDIGEPKLEKSDKPTDVYTDEIDAFVLSNSIKLENIEVQKKEANVKDVEKILTEEETEAVNLNKKAEFLMAMLDEYNNDEMRYYGTAPVEEPIIVPKRRHGRHICDDHDKLNKALSTTDYTFTDGHDHSHINTEEVQKPVRKHSKKEEGPKLNITHSQNADESRPSPRKPDRDMDKYRNSMELKIPTPPIITRSLEAIQNEPNTNSSQSVKLNTNETSFQSELSPTLNELEKLDTILKKCSSSQSFLTPDLMDQIVNKVYGFKMNWDDHDNVHHSGYDDYSGQVAPSSKLKTRKISVIRKDQISEKPIVEESSESEKTVQIQSETVIPDTTNDNHSSNFSIGDVSIKISAPPSENHVANRKASLPKDSESSISLDSILATAKLAEKNKEEEVTSETLSTNEHLLDIAHHISLERDEESQPKLKNEVLHNLLSKNEPLEKYSPNEISTIDQHTPSTHSVEDPNSIKVHASVKSKLDSNKGAQTLVADDVASVHENHSELIMTNNSDDAVTTTKHALKKSDTVIEIKQLATKPAQSSVNVLDDIYSQNRSVLTSFHTYLNEPLKDTIIPDPDHNSNETDTNPNVVLSNDRRGSIVDHDVWFNEHNDASAYVPTRVESDVTITYETDTIYPFGTCEKSVSGSSEFFGTKVEEAISKADKNHFNKTKVESNETDDHSTLLKYLPSPAK